jgi:hypothetical protein
VSGKPSAERPWKGTIGNALIGHFPTREAAVTACDGSRLLGTGMTFVTNLVTGERWIRDANLRSWRPFVATGATVKQQRKAREQLAGGYWWERD